MSMLEEKLLYITQGLQEIGRLVYYAKMAKPSSDVEVHLNRILEILGVTHPHDVGLSNSVLDKIKK